MESLADTGLATMKRFKLLQELEVDSVGNQSHEWPKHLFLAQFDRFELWAVNLGVFVMGHGSLDYRIRDSESMKEAILQMMKNLNRSIDEALAYLGDIEQEDVDSDTDSSSEMESDMDLLLDSIKDPIDRLYKMAVWIRNPATRIPSTKAQNLQQVDEETNVDLFKSFKSFDYDYVSSLFLEYAKNKAMQENPTSSPHNVAGDYDPLLENWLREQIRTTSELNRVKISSGDESYLVRRIARANGLRRQQFAYWRKHKNKLREHAAVVVEVPMHNLLTASHVIQLEDKNEKLKAPLSVTTATQLHLSHGAEKEIFEREYVKDLVISEYAPSAWNPSKDIVRFPAPPKRFTATEFFECPYCYTICPSSLLSEKAWRAHLIRDLRPYICTYEHCSTPQQLYDTRDDWIQHETSTHQTVFRCPQHEEKMFTTLEEYEEHMKEYNEEYSMSLNLAKSTITNIRRSCPICSIVLGTIQKLQSHIALHFERFAMFALPRSTDNDEEDEEDASKRQATNHSSNSKPSCNSTVNSHWSLTERLDAIKDSDISTKGEENSDAIMEDVLKPGTSSKEDADDGLINNSIQVLITSTRRREDDEWSTRATSDQIEFHDGEWSTRAVSDAREYDAEGRSKAVLRTGGSIVINHRRRDYDTDTPSPRYKHGYQ